MSCTRILSVLFILNVQGIACHGYTRVCELTEFRIVLRVRNGRVTFQVLRFPNLLAAIGHNYIHTRQMCLPLTERCTAAASHKVDRHCTYSKSALVTMLLFDRTSDDTCAMRVVSS